MQEVTNRLDFLSGNPWLTRVLQFDDQCLHDRWTPAIIVGSLRQMFWFDQPKFTQDKQFMDFSTLPLNIISPASPEDKSSAEL
ncbi:hypothetical protein RRG08_010555 [Elysia crispata]|uniref:Uncharacterized protein n=1 Tax=Elysia crispata TaxID=231223 RepID=A0AAE0ZDU9_9GAST|nr:hypothetical protein RRG08_010555 [Elysia crispata]